MITKQCLPIPTKSSGGRNKLCDEDVPEVITRHKGELRVFITHFGRDIVERVRQEHKEIRFAKTAAGACLAR